MRQYRDEELTHYIVRMIAHHIMTMEYEGGLYDSTFRDRLDQFLSVARTDVVAFIEAGEVA